MQIVLYQGEENEITNYKREGFLKKTMSENISITSLEDTASPTQARFLKTIIIGGVTVGIMDCLAATINAGRKGVTFTQVWQYVASGLLGKDSYNYGWKSMFLGLLIHFFIAFSVTTVYYLASLQFSVLIRQTLLCGILYGIAVYFVMGYVVSPLSAAAKLSFSFTSMLIGIFIHIICVGLPIAFIVRRFVKSSQETDFTT